jgi:hypothetical protein
MSSGGADEPLDAETVGFQPFAQAPRDPSSALSLKLPPRRGVEGPLEHTGPTVDSPSCCRPGPGRHEGAQHGAGMVELFAGRDRRDKEVPPRCAGDRCARAGVRHGHYLDATRLQVEVVGHPSPVGDHRGEEVGILHPHVDPLGGIASPRNVGRDLGHDFATGGRAGWFELRRGQGADEVLRRQSVLHDPGLPPPNYLRHGRAAHPLEGLRLQPLAEHRAPQAPCLAQLRVEVGHSEFREQAPERVKEISRRDRGNGKKPARISGHPGVGRAGGRSRAPRTQLDLVHEYPVRAA